MVLGFFLGHHLESHRGVPESPPITTRGLSARALGKYAGLIEGNVSERLAFGSKGIELFFSVVGPLSHLLYTTGAREKANRGASILSVLTSYVPIVCPWRSLTGFQESVTVVPDAAGSMIPTFETGADRKPV